MTEEGVKIFKEPSKEDRVKYSFPSLEQQINDFIKSQSYVYFDYETKDIKWSPDGQSCILLYKIGNKKGI